MLMLAVDFTKLSTQAISKTLLPSSRKRKITDQFDFISIKRKLMNNTKKIKMKQKEEKKFFKNGD